MNKTKKAFTLVELIVVITILSILGTIAFISFQGYSKSSRDSVRISDMVNIEKTLEFFYLDSGKYPLPTDYTEITYSGSISLWKQGLFGESTKNTLDRLDIVPVDPESLKEYTYSVTSNNQEYELAGIMESGDISNLLTSLNASSNELRAFIKGNYNGIYLLSKNNINTYIFALPSLISGDLSYTGITDILSNNSLIFNGYNNLPDNYKNSKYSHKPNLDLDLINATYFILFKGDIDNLLETNEFGSFNRHRFIESLQLAYNGTKIENDEKISKLLSLDLGKKTNIDIYSTSILSGGKMVGGKDYSLGDNYDWTIGVACLGASAGDVIYESTGTNDDSGLNCSHDIAICTGYGIGYIIESCNVGAKSIDVDNPDSYGLYFQYGRNKGFSSYDSFPESTAIDNNLFNQEDDIYPYIWGSTISGNRGDWLLTADENIWGYPSLDPLYIKGPCPYGYHVPTNSEWLGVVESKWDLADANLGTEMRNELKLPFGGGLSYNNGNIFNVGSNGYYWSTKSCCDLSYYLSLRNGSINPSINYSRAFGYNVRCFKN